MKNKIVGICICLLMIAMIAFPTVATQHKVARTGQNEYESLQTQDERPVICIDYISGGRGINAVLKNVGWGYAAYVNWSIDIEGGFILGETHFEGVFEEGMGFEDEIEIGTGRILGFGLVEVNISCEYPYVEEDRATIKWKYWNYATYLILFSFSFPPKILNPQWYKYTLWTPVNSWKFEDGILYWYYGSLVGWYDVRCINTTSKAVLWYNCEEWGKNNPGEAWKAISWEHAVYDPLIDEVNAGYAEWQVRVG